MKKILFAVVVLSCVTVIASCMFLGNEKITISIDECPDENDNPDAYASFMSGVEDFEKLYPNIQVNPDKYIFSADNFEEKMKAHEIPNCFHTYFTEVKKYIEKGYAYDLTEMMSENGWIDYINPELTEFLTDGKGRVFALPVSTYVMAV